MAWNAVKEKLADGARATVTTITGKVPALRRGGPTTQPLRPSMRRDEDDPRNAFQKSVHAIEESVDDDSPVDLWAAAQKDESLDIAPWETVREDDADDALEVLIDRLESGKFTLPLMPKTVRQAIDLTRDPNSSFVGLSTIIETDPPLSGQLLKLANSPLFGGMNRVGSLKQALIRVGLDGVRELLLVASTSRILVVPGNRRLTDRLQHRAVAVALAANALAHRRGDTGDEAFTAGVLHDVGLAVAWQLIKECKGSLPEGVRDDVHAQKALADRVHTELGARLAKAWRLPPGTAAVLRWHHEPQGAGSAGKLTRYVAAGIELADHLGVYPERPGGPALQHRAAIQALELDGAEITAICTGIRRRLGLSPV